MNEYFLLDCGHQKKLEQFGPYKIIRPCSQAVWRPKHPEKWEDCDAVFTREGAKQWKGTLPDSWMMQLEGLTFKVGPTDFGHLGIFPEHHLHWNWVEERVRSRSCEVLNLFAYSGGMTLAAARGGGRVVHLDASKGMVSWARENAQLNQLEDKPIRWIVEDVEKFLRREVKRGRRYDAIILDPPTFGRGNRGELFKIEEDLPLLLALCRELLSDHPLFLLLTCHTPGYTGTVMHHLIQETLPHGTIESGETLLKSRAGLDLPCGHFARILYA